MDDTRWIRFKEKHEPHIVGEFENDFGERFVIYRNKNGGTPYITGDELDWTLRVPLLWNNANFMLSAVERDHVARILWPTGDELLSGNVHPGSSLARAAAAEMAKRGRKSAK